MTLSLPHSSFSERRERDNQGTDFKDTENKDSENQDTQDKDTDNPEPLNKDTQNQNHQNRMAFPRRAGKKKISLNPPDTPPRKKKLKAATIKRGTATKNQISPFLNSKQSSKKQGFFQIAEEDTLDLLCASDPAKTLKGNEWPVFIFMSLKGYAWDSSQKRCRDGKRRFATNYVARGTALAESTAWEVLNRLIAKGFIKLLEIDQNQGNLYHVSPILLY